MRRSFVAGSLLVACFSLAVPATAADPMSRYYAADTEGIFWFLHITDTHIDTSEALPVANLEFALNEAVQVAAPVAVFASGDLVDGTILGIPTSGQDSAEWDIYETLLYDAQVTPSFYFDLPGNHDTYDDQGLTHYLESSMQGQATGTFFADAIHTTPLGDYYFVAMNSSGPYGTPFTFGDPQFTNVDALEAGLAAQASAKLVFVFAQTHHLVAHGATDAQMVLGIGRRRRSPWQRVGSDDDAGGCWRLLSARTRPPVQGEHARRHGHLLSSPTSPETRSWTTGPLEAWDETKHESNLGIGIVDHNAFIYGVTDTANPWPLRCDHGTGRREPSRAVGALRDPPRGLPTRGTIRSTAREKNPYAYDVCLDRSDNPVRALVLSKEPVAHGECGVGFVGAGEHGSCSGPAGHLHDDDGHDGLGTRAAFHHGDSGDRHADAE